MQPLLGARSGHEAAPTFHLPPLCLIKSFSSFLFFFFILFPLKEQCLGGEEQIKQRCCLKSPLWPPLIPSAPTAWTSLVLWFYFRMWALMWDRVRLLDLPGAFHIFAGDPWRLSMQMRDFQAHQQVLECQHRDTESLGAGRTKVQGKPLSGSFCACFLSPVAHRQVLGRAVQF